MKKTVYKDKSKEDLAKALREKREDLRKMRFAASGSKSRNVKEVKNIRKEIARIMTEFSKIKNTK